MVENSQNFWPPILHGRWNGPPKAVHQLQKNICYSVKILVQFFLGDNQLSTTSNQQPVNVKINAEKFPRPSSSLHFLNLIKFHVLSHSSKYQLHKENKVDNDRHHVSQEISLVLDHRSVCWPTLIKDFFPAKSTARDNFLGTLVVLIISVD